MPALGSHLTGPVKHRANKENSGLREWYSNLPVGGDDPDYVVNFNDFRTATAYSTSDYTLTLVGTGTVVVSTTLVNGIMVVTTTNSSADSNNVQNKIPLWKFDNSVGANDPFLAGKRIWWETSISLSRVADVDMFVGLSELNTTLLASANYAGFRISNGSAVISMVNASASTASSVSTTISAVASTSIKLGMLYDGGNSIKFYVNRSWVASQNSNIPSVVLAESLHLKTDSANAAVCNQDYVFIAKER